MEEIKIGVFICNCGTNIAHHVDLDAVLEAAAAMPGVAVARSYRYMCSNPGQEMISQDIKERNLDRVVVAACSPRMHERTFRAARRRRSSPRSSGSSSPSPGISRSSPATESRRRSPRRRG